MRILAATAVVAACIASAALAQQQDPLVFVPEWEARPSQQDYIRNYPPAALRSNISGIAVLCCMPNTERGIDCVANSEHPAGQGFGAASVNTSRSYRLSPASFGDLQARPGTPVRISVRWVAAVPSPGAVDELRRIDRETAHACLPPAP